MRSSKTRFLQTTCLMIMGGALSVLAGCTQAEVASPGSGAPIQPIVVPPGGSTGTGLAQNNVPPAGCPTGTTQNANVNLGDNVQRAFCVLSGTVTGNVSLPANNGLPYLIAGSVFVGQDAGAASSLTIAPGAVLFGNDADNASLGQAVDLLVVSRGSRLVADGTAAAPIIFTSAQDLLDNGRPDGSVDARGQWGGIAINGFAPINDCSANPGAVGGSAACIKNGEGGSGLFGGDRPNDNSGILRYVRIQHAGFQFSATNELNGLALQGVGNGTIIDFLQVHNNADDGIEFFGGTVNARNLVLTGNDDDNIDWTDGWSGNVQFALVVQTGTAGDNGIEADNLGSSPNALPRSNPNVSNFTLISNNRTLNSSEGIQVRAGTNGRIVNGVVTGFGEGLEYNAQAGAPQPVVNSIAFNGNAALVAAGGANATSTALFNAGTNNRQNTVATLTGILPGPNETSTPATDPTTLGAFFTPANYVGAFGPNDTASNNFTSGWTVNVPGAPAIICPAGTTRQTGAIPQGRTETNICRVNRPVVTNVTLTRGNLYEIEGPTFVGIDTGPDPVSPVAGGVSASLTIDPGVTLFSEGRTGFDILVVSRGSQIFANGSAAAPIIMTSREAVFNNTGRSGDWGGLTINGRAPINDCNANPGATGGTLACSKNGEASTGLFGGASPNDNSGRLNYVRIENAGFQFSGTNEANSLTLQGVGAGTNIDFIQTIFGADDGVEFFGGTVDIRHLVVVGAEDDAFDWTDGWSGRAQFVIVRQDNILSVNDNGIEADNLSASPLATPRSNPTLSNFTLIGAPTVATSASNEGIQVRAGTDGRLLNMIVTGFGQGAEYNPTESTSNPPVRLASDPVLNSIVFTANQALTGSTQTAALLAAGANNVTSNLASTLTVRQGFTAALLPGANERTTVTNPVPISSFFAPVDFVGAVRDANDNWYVGWTRGL